MPVFTGTVAALGGGDGSLANVGDPTRTRANVARAEMWANVLIRKTPIL
jgi:hypothetical protein